MENGEKKGRKEKRVFPMEMVKQQYKKKIIVFGGDSNFLTKVEGDTDWII